MWSFDIDPSGQRLVTGSSDGLLRVWRAVGEEEAAAELAAAGSDADLVLPPGEVAMEVEGGGGGRVVHAKTAARLAGSSWKLIGMLARQTNDRAATVRFSDDGELVGCQAAGKPVCSKSV